jgi:hypothetical protein
LASRVTAFATSGIHDEKEFDEERKLANKDIGPGSCVGEPEQGRGRTNDKMGQIGQT